MIKAPILVIIKGTWKKLGDPYFAGSAAEVAFWLLLSLMPATIVLAQLLQIFTISMDAARNVLLASLSPELFDIIAPFLDYSSRKGVTILLVVIALFAGSNAVFAITRIINLAYGNIPKTNNTIQIVNDRIRSIFMTLLMLATMIFALYILVYGEVLVKTVLVYVNGFLGNNYAFSEVWYGMRWVIAGVLFFVMVFVLYYALPHSGMSYREQLKGVKLVTVKNIFSVWLKGRRMEYMRAMPGCMFSAVTMLIVTRVYTLFVQNAAFGNINILYGGLSSVVVLLLWFYAMSYVLIAGIQVNSVYSEYAAGQESTESSES